jgi:uncharacterized protein YgbK (DUF1537 family)
MGSDMRLGIIAEDFTSATETGLRFARRGYIVHVYAHAHFPQQYTAALQNGHAPDVVVIDTAASSNPYTRVFDATQALEGAGASRIIEADHADSLIEDMPETNAVLPPMPDIPFHDGLGMVCVADSIAPHAAVQFDYLHKHGVGVYELHPLRLFDAEESAAEVQRLSDTLVMEIRHGRDVLLYRANSPQALEAIETKAEQFALDQTEVSHLISEGLGEIVARVTRRSGQNRLVIAGNTGAICNSLNVYGMRVLAEVSPGIPLCVSLTDPLLLIAFKGDYVDAPNALYSAIEYLRQH